MRYMRRIICRLSPKLLTKIIYKRMFKKRINLKNPQNINEKLQYLKFNDYYKNEIITMCVDKYEARKYLQSKGYSSLSPKTYQVIDNINQIKWDDLPSSFIIKCNNGSGMNIIVENKSIIDKRKIENILKKWLKSKYWLEYAELQYKYVNNKIIFEELLDANIKTYKFYCFNGKCKFLYVESNSNLEETNIDYYDTKWNWIDMRLGLHGNSNGIEKPDNLEKMLQISENLAEGFPFVRIDLFDVNGEIYFSEFTFIPTGGFMELKPECLIDEWGSYLKL